MTARGACLLVAKVGRKFHFFRRLFETCTISGTCTQFRFFSLKIVCLEEDINHVSNETKRRRKKEGRKQEKPPRKERERERERDEKESPSRGGMRKRLSPTDLIGATSDLM